MTFYDDFVRRLVAAEQLIKEYWPPLEGGHPEADRSESELPDAVAVQAQLVADLPQLESMLRGRPKEFVRLADRARRLTRRGFEIHSPFPTIEQKLLRRDECKRKRLRGAIRDVAKLNNTSVNIYDLHLRHWAAVFRLLRNHVNMGESLEGRWDLEEVFCEEFRFAYGRMDRRHADKPAWRRLVKLIELMSTSKWELRDNLRWELAHEPMHGDVYLTDRKTAEGHPLVFCVQTVSENHLVGGPLSNVDDPHYARAAWLGEVSLGDIKLWGWTRILRWSMIFGEICWRDNAKGFVWKICEEAESSFRFWFERHAFPFAFLRSEGRHDSREMQITSHLLAAAAQLAERPATLLPHGGYA